MTRTRKIMGDLRTSGVCCRLYHTLDGPLAEVAGRFYALGTATWDELFNEAHLRERLLRAADVESERPAPSTDRLRPPIEGQEVWAAGVTYVRSRTARVAESRDAGGGTFYDRVYEAERPELFFKATPNRVAGPGQAVRVRRDSTWCVPEPELALAVNAAGRIIGYTIGNDMSARDIEGENPLYLPQAKVYDQCCGLGPAVLVPEAPLSSRTAIQLVVRRRGATVFDGHTTLGAMRRTPEELVAYLYLDNSFPRGCFLLTGTGIVPPDAFTLHPGDRVRITIEPIGTLENHVVQYHA